MPEHLGTLPEVREETPPMDQVQILSLQHKFNTEFCQFLIRQSQELAGRTSELAEKATELTELQEMMDVLRRHAEAVSSV